MHVKVQVCLVMCSFDIKAILKSYLGYRKVQTESSTGSTSSNKVRTVLTVTVEAIDFDTQACVLRVKGRNIQENQYVKVKSTDSG